MSTPVSAPNTEDPKPATETATTADPAVTPLARWPWVATAILAGIAILIFVITLVNGWSYVTTKNETQETEDWEQLLGLIGRVDTLVTLILGAVLGVGVGAAKQSGDTKAAAAAANANAAEALRQNNVAKANQGIATRNKQVAELRRGDLDTALAFAARVHADASARQQDESRFAGEDVVHLLRNQRGVVDSMELMTPVDPVLKRLGAEAAALLHEMQAKYQ